MKSRRSDCSMPCRKDRYHKSLSVYPSAAASVKATPLFAAFICLAVQLLPAQKRAVLYPLTQFVRRKPKKCLRLLALRYIYMVYYYA